jgi:hypothetical protein
MTESAPFETEDGYSWEVREVETALAGVWWLATVAGNGLVRIPTLHRTHAEACTGVKEFIEQCRTFDELDRELTAATCER